MDETIKKKVLVVDDEPAVRRLVRKILSKDYIVLEAQNGEEAVNMSQESSRSSVGSLIREVLGIHRPARAKKPSSMKRYPNRSRGRVVATRYYPNRTR